MKKANKLLLRIEILLGFTIFIIALASSTIFESTKIDLKFGAINAIACGAIIILTSLFFVKDNKEKVSTLLNIAVFICYVGALVLMTTIINVSKWFYIIAGTILATLGIVHIIFVICAYQEDKKSNNKMKKAERQLTPLFIIFSKI